MNSFIPGSASLVEEVDKRLLVLLRDGRNLVGILRTFDQFANLVLEDTVERVYVDGCYGEIDLGVFLVRGENVVLLGDLDEEKEKAMAERKRPLNELVGDGVVPGSSGDGTLGGDSTAQPMPRPAALSGARLQSIRSAIAIQEDPIS